MKHLFTIAILLFFSLELTAQDQQPEFKFEKELINYGKVAQNSNGKRVFVFTNVGKSPLIISQVKASCGCTVPKKPKDPIMPGEKGEIEVSYDTKRVGGFSKAITIYSNAKNPRKVLRIRGIVEKISLEKTPSIVSQGK